MSPEGRAANTKSISERRSNFADSKLTTRTVIDFDNGSGIRPLSSA